MFRVAVSGRREQEASFVHLWPAWGTSALEAWSWAGLQQLTLDRRGRQRPIVVEVVAEELGRAWACGGRRPGPRRAELAARPAMRQCGTRVLVSSGVPENNRWSVLVSFV